MFLLSEGTLLFLDLALNARPCGEKPSLSSVVQKWVDEVAAATDSGHSLHGADTTVGASSTLYAPPSVCPSTAVGQTSLVSGCVASENMSLSASGFSKAFFLEDNNDVEEIGMVTTSDAGHDSSKGVKRKLDDIDITYTSDIESNLNKDDLQKPVPLADSARQIAKVTRTELLPRKRTKCADASVSMLSMEPPRSCAAFITQLHTPHRAQVNNDAYIAEVIRKPPEYTTRDLPVSCDQRWSQSFLATAILWYSVQSNIWNVPDVNLTSALQRIFNVVYPDITYRVTPAGSVFALTLQRIHEWRGSFGSSALAMILHFFSSLNRTDDVHAAAEFLVTDFRFLRADPDSSDPTEPFHSPFLLMLLAITHLGDIAAFVDVPGWDTRAMAAGEGAEGVIAIASAALEFALTLFRDRTLDVDHILAKTTRRPDASLLETVLDTHVPPALWFSSDNWNSHVEAYREAVGKRGTVFVRATFAAAEVKRRRMGGDKDGESDVDDGMGVSGNPDPRALL